MTVEDFEANPFLLSPDERMRRVEAIRGAQKKRVIMQAVEAGDAALAERRALAIGHAEAIARDETILGMPQRIWDALPHERSHYLRIVAAAARCYHALEALQGESKGMRAARRETWAACFGDGLYHTLCLEKVIIDHDVLVLGETGTGKEAIAHAIQEGLPGKGEERAPRSALNAAAVPETLVESELFGHVKGAFTGASEDRRGRIRSARGGCFFLDEVGDLPETTQVKLLRVMETNQVHPLGSDKGYEADVRYVAATHKDLAAMVDDGKYRRDLYQRLAGHVIELPPLRDRREDIPALGRAFVARYIGEQEVPEVWARVERWLQRAATRTYSWPGNVRELQNALRSVMLGLEPRIGGAAPSPSSLELPKGIEECSATMLEVEQWYLRRVLAHTGRNFAHSARILGMDRATVRRRTKKLPGT